MGGKKRKCSDETGDSPSLENKQKRINSKTLKIQRPGFNEERYNETSYYVENGLRKVYPYYFTFTSFTKGRWVGQKLLDIFSKEFRAHPAHEYERCINSGTVTINYNKVKPDYLLKHNDLLSNTVHRHEVPVTADPIQIIHIDDDILVVNKPASIPVHPCGRYRHNTVIFILAKEHNLKNLRTIHRLDRLTSGLLLFGRTVEKAREMEQVIRNRQVSKEYVCRVEGDFPDGEVECKEPIQVVSYKIGVCKVSPDGKDCSTTFKKIRSCSGTSIVLAKPQTGRMHQIRVHLQYLGYPILNDPLYNHEVFGPEKGKGGKIGKSDEQLIQELISIHNAENWVGSDEDCLEKCPVPLAPLPRSDLDQNPSQSSNEESPALNPNHLDNNEKLAHTGPKSSEVGSQVTSKETKTNEEEVKESTDVKISSVEMPGECQDTLTFNKDLMTYDSHCEECKLQYRDPKPQDLIMYLHALRYSGPNWSFETQMPAWASPHCIDADGGESSSIQL